MKKLIVTKSREKAEFGDFQTPDDLARRCVQTLEGISVPPSTVIEPTCGRGAFIRAVLEQVPMHTKIIGVDRNSKYLEELQAILIARPVEITCADFFTVNWQKIVQDDQKMVWIIGNPPWVTNAGVGSIGGSNLPVKSNFQNMAGLEALTGKSNFDISEWMILDYIKWTKAHASIIAVLCKTAVARKILGHVLRYEGGWKRARLYGIEALREFGAAVDASWFVLERDGHPVSKDCEVYESLDASAPSRVIGFHDGVMVSDVADYTRWRHLRGTDAAFVWRSGLKHDCSRVMELERVPSSRRNGFGEVVDIEDHYVFPLFKSSDLGGKELRQARKEVIVTQQWVGQDTSEIKTKAPKTWSYLNKNASYLDARGSIIYRNKPKYSIFGVGDYTFTDWKVAISGFYKNVNFKIIGPISGKPAIVDDTVYFLPCYDEKEARWLAAMLNSKPAHDFISSMIFLLDKRPITIDLLKRLSIAALATELGCQEDYGKFSNRREYRGGKPMQTELLTA